MSPLGRPRIWIMVVFLFLKRALIISGLYYAGLRPEIHRSESDCIDRALADLLQTRKRQ